EGYSVAIGGGNAMISTTLALAIELALGAVSASAGEAAALQWWVEPAARKVFEDSPPGATRVIDLAAARGEWESAQVVLLSAAGGGPGSPRAARPLAPPPAPSPAAAIEVRQVAYVPVPFAGKSWPDPLVPLAGGRTGALPAGKDRSILLTVRVPRGAEPGDYLGTLRMQPDEGGDLKVPLSLHVWP